MSTRSGGSKGCKTKALHGILTGSPMKITLGQQFNNIGEKPPVILYAYINRHAFTASCTVSGLWRFSSSSYSAVRVSIIVLYLSLLFDDALFCLSFCWCPCMAINVSVQYDGWFLPDIILLTQCYYHRRTRLNAMKRFCIFSYWSHLNILTFFPPDWGMLRRSRCIQIFL